MKGLIDFFTKEAPNVSDSKYHTATEIPMVTSYTRETYLTVSLLLSCDCSIYGKLVEEMGNSYTMGKVKHPRTLTNMQNLLANWRNSARTTPRRPTDGLSFTQEIVNNKSNRPTNGGHIGRPQRGEEVNMLLYKYPSTTYRLGYHGV